MGVRGQGPEPWREPVAYRRGARVDAVAIRIGERHEDPRSAFSGLDVAEKGGVRRGLSFERKLEGERCGLTGLPGFRRLLDARYLQDGLRTPARDKRAEDGDLLAVVVGTEVDRRAPDEYCCPVASSFSK